MSLLSQCSLKADVLFDNFRTDIYCEVLQKFKEHGVDIPELKALAKLIPVVFPNDDCKDVI